MNEDQLQQLMAMSQQQQEPTDLGGYYGQEEEEPAWLKALNRILSPLSGIGSIPDVLHDTNFKNPLSVMMMPTRYARNVGAGILGGFGMGTPEYNDMEDFMDKYGLMQDSKLKPLVGFAGDIALDPTSYLGAGLVGKGAKGIGSASKKAGSKLSSLYKK
jgi:hypothetical protein